MSPLHFSNHDAKKWVGLQIGVPPNHPKLGTFFMIFGDLPFQLTLQITGRVRIDQNEASVTHRPRVRTNVVLGAFLTILIFLFPYPLTALQGAQEAATSGNFEPQHKDLGKKDVGKMLLITCESDMLHTLPTNCYNCCCPSWELILPVYCGMLRALLLSNSHPVRLSVGNSLLGQHSDVAQLDENTTGKRC